MIADNQAGATKDVIPVLTRYTGFPLAARYCAERWIRLPERWRQTTSVRMLQPVSGQPATTLHLGNGTNEYANVTTICFRYRTVEFLTTNWTKAQKYTIRVEQNFGRGQIKSDEVDVNVEKGAVTIVAAGDQSYYLGEEIKFSGTNTETTRPTCSLSDPTSRQHGAQIQNADPRNFQVT